jgi:hypothetical protein
MYIVERVLVAPFLLELDMYLHTHPWDERRSLYVAVQRETRAILLRRAKNMFERVGEETYHPQFTEESAEARYFPITVKFLEQFAARRGGLLSRVTIVSLSGQKQVYPHIDQGEYYQLRDRYHLVLRSEGSTMISGADTKIFNEGDLFYFNNHVLHEAYNHNNSERIHIIFDILPKDLPTFVGVGVSVLKTLLLNTQRTLTSFLEVFSRW